MTIAGQPIPHESARGHVTGDALYTDDLSGRFPHLLHAWPVLAPHAHAMVTSLDPLAALAEPRRRHRADRTPMFPGRETAGRIATTSRCFPMK